VDTPIIQVTLPLVHLFATYILVLLSYFLVPCEIDWHSVRFHKWYRNGKIFWKAKDYKIPGLDHQYYKAFHA
jgi:hypothetical protein